VTDTDPDFAPIEGVDLESYAKATAAVAKAGATTAEEAAKVAEANGIPAGKWQTVSDGWVARMSKSMPVRTQFGTLYMKY
jgi:crotonobetainyl-CoA:carnitine CoA-transferase CaiB-like acyl-CoA transferase